MQKSGESRRCEKRRGKNCHWRPCAKFFLVGIGASAGGLEALEDFLANIPPDTGMAFVVVTHQHPGHTSMLPEFLSQTTTLPVEEIRDGVKVEPNHVYVDPAGNYLAIFNGVLHHMKIGSGETPRLPIDYFFRSLGADQKEKAICIVLSGTGTDGALVFRAIKAELGMVVVQEVQSAKYSGMTTSAIATGLADFVLPAAEVPEQLVAYARGPYLAAPRLDETVELPTEPMQKIFVLLRTRTGHDFFAYKPNTIRQRVERRMNLHQIKGPMAYLRYLQDNPNEIDILFKELLSCRRGETIRGVQCLRSDKSGRELPGSLPLSLLTDDRGAPETISMTIKHIAS